MPSADRDRRAVSGWSPVIITGVMPACRHSATACAASGRGGSIRPTKPTNVSSALDRLGRELRRARAGQSRRAIASTRRPSRGHLLRLLEQRRGVDRHAPVARRGASTQRSSTGSGAPLVNATTPSSACRAMQRRHALALGVERQLRDARHVRLERRLVAARRRAPPRRAPSRSGRRSPRPAGRRSRRC